MIQPIETHRHLLEWKSPDVGSESASATGTDLAQMNSVHFHYDPQRLHAYDLAVVEARHFQLPVAKAEHLLACGWLAATMISHLDSMPLTSVFPAQIRICNLVHMSCSWNRSVVRYCSGTVSQLAPNDQCRPMFLPFCVGRIRKLVQLAAAWTEYVLP